MMVLRRRWLSEADFAVMLGLGQVLPGPNIVNVAVAVGSRFHGVGGAAAAIAGLLLAPMVIVLLLASFMAITASCRWCRTCCMAWLPPPLA